MKLSIDAYNIALEYGTGVATYGRNLASTAASLGHDIGLLFGARSSKSRVPLLNEIAISEGDALFTGKRGILAKGKDALSNAKYLLSPFDAYQITFSGDVLVPGNLRTTANRHWNSRNLYRSAIAQFRTTGIASSVNIPEVDVAHWTYPLPLEARGALNIYTLHDLIPLKLPYTTADRKRDYYKLCKRIARRADHILTVSECSRRDIIQILGVNENKVSNLYQSTDVEQHIEGVTAEVLDDYVRGLLGVGMREFYLFFGAIEPKKNVARILEAYLGSGSKAPLVIVGAPGWGGDADVKLLKSVTKLDANERILWLGYLPREMLVMLIAAARATLLPSLYEGFGLPVIESMALGTPVITSDTASMPEVAGDAAVLVNPYKSRDIANAIKMLDADPEQREDLSKRGLVQAQRFSSAEYAKRLANFYDQLG